MAKKEAKGDQGDLLKWCEYGQHYVPATDEYFSRDKRLGLYSYCKECCKAIYREKAETLKLKRMAKK